jgi:hypothetical protein
MSVEQEKFFHGPLYSEGRWTTPNYVCCRLCKTKGCEGKNKHWAKGLCRTCYRRLSLTHRLYNDSWAKNRINLNRQRSREPIGKKDYKLVDSVGFQVLDLDIDTLLPRYDWRCAYSGRLLQDYDHKAENAFQAEYIVRESGILELVPVCRLINCSKKSLKDEAALKKWAEKIGVAYPFYYISPEEF